MTDKDIHIAIFIHLNCWMWIETLCLTKSIRLLYLSSSLTAGCGLKLLEPYASLCITVQLVFIQLSNWMWIEAWSGHRVFMIFYNFSSIFTIGCELK